MSQQKRKKNNKTRNRTKRLLQVLAPYIQEELDKGLKPRDALRRAADELYHDSIDLVNLESQALKTVFFSDEFRELTKGKAA